MPCTHVTIDGVNAIVCGPRSRTKPCACGARAVLLCDWKVEGKRTGTCDAPICSGCALEPSPDKHLCKTHQVAFGEWKAARVEGGR